MGFIFHCVKLCVAFAVDWRVQKFLEGLRAEVGFVAQTLF